AACPVYTERMNEHFMLLAQRYEELALTVAQPETIQDQPRFQAIMREMADLEPQVNAYAAYKALEKEAASVRELLANPELKQMAQEELNILESRLQVQEEALRLMQLPKDELDERDVVMEVRAGTGGEEAALFG